LQSGITGKKLLQSGSLINVKRRSFGIGKPANPIHAIVWQDRRTAKYCDELKAAGYANLIQKKDWTFRRLFSGTKVKWILDNVEGHVKAEQGKLCFGTVDTWLI
jgi:glycerol kinase